MSFASWKLCIYPAFLNTPRLKRVPPFPRTPSTPTFNNAPVASASRVFSLSLSLFFFSLFSFSFFFFLFFLRPPLVRGRCSPRFFPFEFPRLFSWGGATKGATTLAITDTQERCAIFLSCSTRLLFNAGTTKAVRTTNL